MGIHPLAQPMYVNMHELASLAANRAQEMQQHQPIGGSIGPSVSVPVSTAIAATPPAIAGTTCDKVKKNKRLIYSLLSRQGLHEKVLENSLYPCYPLYSCISWISTAIFGFSKICTKAEIL